TILAFPWIQGKDLVFAQCHPPAFQEALLIGLREALQLGWRDPISIEWIWESEQALPNTLEEISLYRRIDPRDECLQAGVGKPQRAGRGVAHSGDRRVAAGWP